MLKAVYTGVSRAGQSPAARRAGRLVWWISGGCVVLLAIVVLVARAGLPLLATHKQYLVTQASDSLGTPVHVDQLALRWAGTGPQIRARGVRFGPVDDARSLRLEELDIDIDFFASLWARRLEVRDIQVSGATLSVVYAHGQAPQVLGLASPVNATGTDGRYDLQALLGIAERVALNDARVTLINRTAESSLSINPVNVRLESDSAAHRLRAELHLPESIGGQISVQFDLDAATAGGGAAVYVEASGLRLRGVEGIASELFDDSPASLPGLANLDADIDAEIWGRWNPAGVDRMRGRLAVRDIDELIDGRRLLDSASADLEWRRLSSGWELQTDSLELNSAMHRSTVSDLRLVHRTSTLSASRHAWHIEAQGERLALADALAVPAAMLGNQRHPAGRWLNAARPSAEIESWNGSLSWGGRPASLSFDGRFQQFALQSAGNWPGLDGLEGAVSIVDSRGDITLRGRGLKIDAPELLSAPLFPDAFVSDLAVDFKRPATASVSGHVVYDDGNLDTTTRLAMTLKPGTLPYLDMQSRFALADVGSTVRYLPLSSMPRASAGWLKRALKGGRAENGELLFHGNIADFPFDAGEGVFRGGVDITAGELDFLPDWPVARQIAGRLEVSGTRLVGTATDGRFDAVQISHGRAEIADLRAASLRFSGTAAGALQPMIDFANTGPLSPWLAPVLNDVAGTGRAEMDIVVDASLSAAVQSSSNGTPASRIPTVRGSVFLDGNDIEFSRAKVVLERVRGAVGFTTRGIRIHDLKARFLDQDVLLDASTEGRGQSESTRVALSGALDVDSLLEHRNLPLTPFFEGRSKWEVLLEVPHRRAVRESEGMRLRIVSDLVGTAVGLPAPFAKPSARTRPIELTTRLYDDARSMFWEIRQGEQLNAEVALGEGEFQAMNVRVGGGKLTERVQHGIHIEGRLPQLPARHWIDSLAALIDALPESDEAERMVPVSIDITTPSMRAGPQKLGQARLQVHSETDYLDVSLTNAYLRGSLQYPRLAADRLPLRIRVAYAEKRLFDGLQAAAGEATDTALDPRRLPPIEARVARLRWEALDLQDVALRTTPNRAGLSIDTLGFAYRDTQLIGTGFWHLRDAQQINPVLADQHVTSLLLTLQSDDIGSGLTRLGYADTMHEGQGLVEADIAWPGPAYAPAIDKLTGTMRLDLRNGRVLGVNPGAARMVGLFALQTLPRRLNLDFKDIVLDGLDFQRIAGDIELANGIASTELVQLEGAVGVVDFAGDINLVTREYDQSITVLPRVSAALPVIGMLSGGAGAGIGALLAGGLLKAIGLDVDRLGLREYHLGGSWDTPEITPRSNVFGRNR